MAHAHHFLSRLDRVSLPHVELALGLYNDVPLLQFILLSTRLPEGAPRVAISLDHPEEGPFLVVTREGRFVTCLGAGMSVDDLPIITRGQLDAIAAKRDDLRARIADAQRLAGPDGNVGKLLTRIGHAGPDLSREEIAAVIGLQPLYAFELIRHLFSAATDLLDAREGLLTQIRRSDRLKPQYHDALRAYWQTFWAVGHLSVLVGQDGPTMLARLPPQLADMLERASISWTAVRQGVMSLALKGTWAVARIGKPLLGGVKQRYRDAETLLQVLDSAMSLAALAQRHAKLQSEVQKAIASGPKGQIIVTPEQIEKINPALAFAVECSDKARATSAKVLREVGAAEWITATRHLPPGAPMRFDRAEDVPEDLAMSYAVNIPYDLLGGPQALQITLMAIPWVARATPEQLYLPRAAIRATQKPWVPEHTLSLLRQQRDYYYKHKPKRPEGPSRQGPCPCGSGKKYKRCCEGVDA